MNFRDVNDDILSDWLNFREGTGLAFANTEDKKHYIRFDDICNAIINNIPKQNRKFVQKQLNALDDNLIDYIGYWQEKYYRNGFCDGVELILGCLDK